MLLAAALVCLGAFNALALPVENNIQVRGDASYFLPDNVIVPISYKVMIDVIKSFDNLDERKFTGSVEIQVESKVPTEEIIMHSADITDINTVHVQDESNGIQYYKSMRFDKVRQFLIINLDKETTKGQILTITIESYTGKLQDDMHGFYISQYKQNHDKEVKTVLTTQFQPTHARKAFPCFDEPKYKATFQITVRKPLKYKVISNTVSREMDNGVLVTEMYFPETPKMSTYLVAFIVHEFENKNVPGEQNYKVWSRPEAINQTEWAVNNVFKIVQDLTQYTGVRYEENMRKMDLAALPDFSAGAMENWGLLTYRETALLVDDDVSTNKDIQRVVSVISHEVAHQWFGNLVTTHWWSNTWLNEGFARFFEYYTTGNVMEDWEMNDQFVVEQLQNVFGVDALSESTALTREVYTPAEISSHFGSISYAKGGSVIRMMQHFLRIDNFGQGLRDYIEKNQFKNTKPEDLWSAFQEVIEERNFDLEYPVKKIMSNWISQPGYPVVNVKYDLTGHVTFSQKRFYINPNENTAEAENSNWFIPICYTTSRVMDFGNTQPNFWLTPYEPTKTILTGGDFDFLVVNIQEVGYYRVNYDNLLWERLAQVLPTEEGKIIHHLNRAQIVDDVLNLARAGLVDYKIAFNVTNYLATETNYYPWYSAFKGFRFLLQRFSDTEDTGIELRSYIKNITELLVRDKEFIDTGERYVNVYNQAAALEWACNLEHDKCVTDAKNLYKQHRTMNKIIPKNLRSIVYCTALRKGDKSDWEFLWNKFEKSNSAAEKIGIINALGCSKDDEILNTFLQKSIDPNSGIRKQDALYVFTAVYSGNSKGVDKAFDFLKNKHPEMIKNYNGMNDLEKAVLGLGTRLTDKTKIDEFKKLLESSEIFANFRKAAFETVDQNLAWASKYGDIIGTVLKKKDTGSAAAILINKYVIFISFGFISIYSMLH